jgi:hypothetical protein
MRSSFCLSSDILVKMSSMVSFVGKPTGYRLLLEGTPVPGFCVDRRFAL